jgi:hypothetical protein
MAGVTRSTFVLYSTLVENPRAGIEVDLDLRIRSSGLSVSLRLSTALSNNSCESIPLLCRSAEGFAMQASSTIHLLREKVLRNTVADLVNPKEVLPCIVMGGQPTGTHELSKVCWLLDMLSQQHLCTTCSRETLLIGCKAADSGLCG